MTTYTWTPDTIDAAWSDPSEWRGPGGALVDQFPYWTDSALVAAGTITVGMEMLAMTVTLVRPVTGVTLAATNVDLGDRTRLLTVAGAPTQTGPIVYDVIGTGTLDDSTQAGGGTGSPGSIDFSGAPLTIELSANTLTATTTASFESVGDITGGNLVIASATRVAAPSTATFGNDGIIEATGILQQAAGVTLSGTGDILLSGVTAAATLEGPVGAGQTIAFTNEVSNGLIRGGITITDLAHFMGTIELDRENQVVVVGETSGVTGYANGVLSFTDGATLDVAPVGDAFSITAQPIPFEDETLVDAPCFRAGTRIATERGEVPVEAVRAGDRVRLARGGTALVVWVGGRTLRCERHQRPHDVWPVRVQASAIAPGVPSRDLFLSPDHAVLVAGALVPVRHLLNGASIAQRACAMVRYLHIELAAHDLLLAEGLAAESFLDTGNRGAFEGGGPALALHPKFARAAWAAGGCAPLVEAGPELAEARRAVRRQAARLGHRRTTDPGLRLFADDRPLRAESDGKRWQARLPHDARVVRLLSRAWVPAHMQDEADDTRRLGVGLGELWLDGREVALDSPALGRGWHRPDPSGRWTDGDAMLDVAGVRVLSFRLAMRGEYWRSAEAGARRA
jgi:Hint domain